MRIVCLRQTRATETRSALKAREGGGLSRMLVTFHLLLPLLSLNYMLTKSSRQRYAALHGFYLAPIDSVPPLLLFQYIARSHMTGVKAVTFVEKLVAGT